MPRILKYEKDGLELKFSPLNYDDSEEIALRKPAEGLDEKALNKFYREWRFDAVAMALNESGAHEKPWTGARVGKELDRVVIDELFNRVLAESGLKATEIRTSEAPGEAPAAS